MKSRPRQRKFTSPSRTSTRRLDRKAARGRQASRPDACPADKKMHGSKGERRDQDSILLERNCHRPDRGHGSLDHGIGHFGARAKRENPPVKLDRRKPPTPLEEPRPPIRLEEREPSIRSVEREPPIRLEPAIPRPVEKFIRQQRPLASGSLSTRA